MKARIVLSDRWSSEHGMKRLQWLWAHPGERTATEQDLFLRRMALLDSGLPLLTAEAENMLQGLPDLLTLEQLPPSASPSPLTCPVCRVDGVSDAVRLTACGHAFCYACLRAWSWVHPHLTCPLCRQTVPLKATSFQRLAAPPQVPPRAVSAPWPSQHQVSYDAVRQRVLRRQLTLAVEAQRKTLVISEWPQVRERLTLWSGPFVTVAPLTEALTLYERDSLVWDQLVVCDSLQTHHTVQAFITQFQRIPQRWYLATRFSLDHFLLSTWPDDPNKAAGPQPVVLEEYAAFLSREILQR